MKRSKMDRKMDRRQFLTSAAVILALSSGGPKVLRSCAKGAEQAFHRVRPGDPSWPSEASWDALRQAVHGRLIKVQSPLAACQTAPEGAACSEVLGALKNPYYLGDEPALTQTSGWADAWTSAKSVYAVAAEETSDVVAAVNFARDHRLCLVVKGGAHSYQGTSNAADSLLIWTRPMKRIVLHDAFVPQGCAGKLAPQPAVSAQAGAVWMDVYDAVTTQAGRYVQGGGCLTVGVAGVGPRGGVGRFSQGHRAGAAGPAGGAGWSSRRSRRPRTRRSGA